MLYKKSNMEQKKEVSRMLSALPTEMDVMRASQSKMTEKEEAVERKRKYTTTSTHAEGPLKKPSVEGNVAKDTKEETKEDTKSEEKPEPKSEPKPSVVLDKDKGLDVHVPGVNMVDFRSL